MSRMVDNLESLDLYFDKKSSFEKWFMIFIFAGAVAFLAYSQFYPYAKKLYDQSVLRHKSIAKKIYESKTYLSSISKNGDKDYKVKFYSKEITAKKGIVKHYNKKITIINSNLDKLSELLFNKKSWSLFLDSITGRAASNGVQINSLANQYIDSNGSFGHVLEIAINCEGDFRDIIGFINDLEQNTLVTDVYSSAIYTDANKSKIISDINISVWGVNH